MRFGPNVFEDAIGVLTKRHQTSTVRVSQERFEELANCTTGLTEEFFVSYFISGLKEEIKVGVQMFQPVNISQAIGLARLQEESTEAMYKKSQAPMKLNQMGWSSASSSTPKPYSNPVIRTDSKIPNPNPQESRAPINPFPSTTSSSPTYVLFKTLTPMEMDARRAKGLCFNCDEWFIKGHRCQKKQLYVITGDEEEEVDTRQDSQIGEEVVLKDEVHI